MLKMDEYAATESVVLDGESRLEIYRELSVTVGLAFWPGHVKPLRKDKLTRKQSHKT